MQKHVSWIVALIVGFVIGLATAGSLGIGGGKRPTALAPQQGTAPSPRTRPNADAQAIYRVPVDGSAAKGPADALVTIVESSDFQCPYCKRVIPTLKQLEQAYPGKLRFVFKHNPLPMHPLAPGAAQAAEAARALGGDEKFWAMHDALFELSPALEQANLESAAQKLGLDAEQFKAAMASSATRDRIDRDQRLVTGLGAGGTPTFFINGRKIAGAYPLDAFKTIVDEELRKAEALVKSGTPAAQVYETIIGQGCDRAGPAAGRAGPDAFRPGGCPGRRLQEDPAAHRRSDPRPCRRTGHRGGLLGLRVPVLWPGRADAEAARAGLRRQGPVRLEAPAPAHAPQRRAGGHRGRGGPRAGEVLAHARQALHGAAGSHRGDLRAVRGGARPRPRQVQGVGGREPRPAPHLGRSAAGEQRGRDRHPDHVLQLPAAGGRRPLRHHEAGRRRGAPEDGRPPRGR